MQNGLVFFRNGYLQKKRAQWSALHPGSGIILTQQIYLQISSGRFSDRCFNDIQRLLQLLPGDGKRWRQL